jgi:uncharacterized iron-regulated membrane protein
MTATAEPPAPGADPVSVDPSTENSTAPPRPAPSGATRRTPGVWSQLRPLVLRLHFYAGVFVAPFLAVAALTGLVYVFSPQLSDAVYSGQLSATAPGAPARPLDEQVAAATAVVASTAPEGALASVVVPGDPARTTEVVFDVPGLAEDWQRTVYVDPSTGQVRGALDTWSGYPPLQATLDGLHRHLLLGEPGRLYSEAAASWLWVLVLGGLALWIGHRRGRRRAAALLLPPFGGRPGRGRLRGWHAATGVWLAVGLLFLSATGLTWSTYAGERFTTVLTALDGRSPQLTAETVAVQEGRPTITVEDAVARARAAGLAGKLAVTVPAEPGAVFRVAENAETWPVQRDSVALDPYTGATVESIAWADYPVPAKLTTIGVLAHMGLLWGLPNQLALAALALGLLGVLFWGYRMAWLRRPTGRALPSAPGGRGALRELSQPVAFGVVVVTVAVCWAVPVLGVTLIGFLALDAVLHRRRTSAAGPG